MVIGGKAGREEQPQVEEEEEWEQYRAEDFDDVAFGEPELNQGSSLVDAVEDAQDGQGGGTGDTLQPQEIFDIFSQFKMQRMYDQEKEEDISTQIVWGHNNSKKLRQKKLEYDIETLQKFLEFMVDNHFNAILKLNEELKQKLDEVQLGGQYNDGLGNQADGSLISPEQIQKSLQRQ